MRAAIGKVRKAIRLLGHPLYRRGLALGIAAAIEHERALVGLGLATLIDVGANKGQFSLLTRALFPQAVIHAFEPLDDAAARFEALFARDELAHLHKEALAEQGGEGRIHVSRRADSSSLLPVTERMTDLSLATQTVRTQTIPLRRGDDVFCATELQRPLMVKLDVQGYELAALRGMRETLARTDFVCVEISFVELYAGQPLADDVVAFLKQQGFVLREIYNVLRGPDGAQIQADALFVRA